MGSWKIGSGQFEHTTDKIFRPYITGLNTKGIIRWEALKEVTKTGRKIEGTRKLETQAR